MWETIVASIVSLFKEWFEGKQKIQQAKQEREIKALTNESDWDKVQAESSQSSWKDEWLTILISIPMIMAFVPGLEQYVLDGFAVLKETPVWYQYMIGVVFAASFGIKKVSNVMRNK